VDNDRAQVTYLSPSPIYCSEISYNRVPADFRFVNLFGIMSFVAEFEDMIQADVIIIGCASLRSAVSATAAFLLPFSRWSRQIELTVLGLTSMSCRNVGRPYCGAEMQHSGRVAVSMLRAQTDRWTDARPLHYACFSLWMRPA